MDNINPGKLYEELVSAGIEIVGCDSTGRVQGLNGKDIQDRPEVQAVISKHDPTPIPEETEEDRIKKIIEKNYKVEKKE